MWEAWSLKGSITHQDGTDVVPINEYNPLAGESKTVLPACILLSMLVTFNLFFLIIKDNFDNNVTTIYLVSYSKPVKHQ